ncbi:hypothetical protein SADUNF_Sadunf02G0102600 [Salix dunnii]|uniref:Uncharacterized protein n=1 Tax=Salix dunnii TaxID=1413687 RepID=A0A835TGJ0_9ROSI|nr:hypothetical protein SADUNF_Sadunf02G0102600 [Salix dunnii]
MMLSLQTALVYSLQDTLVATIQSFFGHPSVTTGETLERSCLLKSYLHIASRCTLPMHLEEIRWMICRPFRDQNQVVDMNKAFLELTLNIIMRMIMASYGNHWCSLRCIDLFEILSINRLKMYYGT